jgi:hypothetical protein
MTFDPFGRERKIRPGRPVPEPYAPRISPEDTEVQLSKSLAVELATQGYMHDFLAELGRWAEAKGTQGYTIEAAPLEGPGTMRWKAVRPEGDSK